LVAVNAGKRHPTSRARSRRRWWSHPPRDRGYQRPARGQEPETPRVRCYGASVGRG